MASTTFSTSGPRNTGNSRCSHAPGSPGLSSPNCSGFFEGGHQLEKLEFALAVAMTRGDASRCEMLRGQIAELGGNIEEPGT